MQGSSHRLLFVGLLLFPVGIWGVLYLNMHYFMNGPQPATTDAVQQLPYVTSPKVLQTPSVIDTQPTFAEGDTLLAAGNRAGALSAYASLSGRVEGTEQNTLLYRLALAGDDPVNSVQLLKALGTDASNTDDMRSHAIEAMGWLYEHASSSDEKTALAGEIFNAPPFDAMMENNDTNLALARLFTYASAIRPSPYADVMAGLYYAEHADLPTTAVTTPTTTSLSGSASLAVDAASHVEVQLPMLKNPIVPGYMNEVQMKFNDLKKKLGPLDPTL